MRHRIFTLQADESGSVEFQAPLPEWAGKRLQVVLLPEEEGGSSAPRDARQAETADIPYGSQSIDPNDVLSVVDTLLSDRITQGPLVPRFEQEIADRTGAHYAVAANSGTSSLHLACRALGLGAGDTLWTSPNTFAASANCGLSCGAEVDFVDIDPATFNLCPRTLARKLEHTRQSGGQLPKVVVAVHFAGLPCEMESIHALSREYGFRIIEDAAHALGGAYQGEPVGSCRYSDFAVFSFHPVKAITTGEGGMAVTNDGDLAHRMRILRSHGITRDIQTKERGAVRERYDHEAEAPWYYEQIDLGHNYRMTEIQAALGLSQLTRLEAFISRRQELADRYDELLTDLPVKRQSRPSERTSARHLYVIRMDRNETGISRSNAFQALREMGIGVNVHYIPVHWHPYYRSLGFEPGMFPQAEAYYREALTLPLYPDMTLKQQDRVIRALKEALGA